MSESMKDDVKAPESTPYVVTCQWIRDDDGVWSHMQFDDDEQEST